MAGDEGAGRARSAGHGPEARWTVPPLDPSQRRATIVASRDGRPVATLTGRFPIPSLFVVDGIEVRPGADGDAARRAFARALAGTLGPSGGDVLLVETEGSAPWRAALEAEGFTTRRRKVVVRRRLDEPLPPAPEGLALRSLAQAGEEEFQARMVLASEGDPFEERRGADRDTEAEWRDLLAHAGARFDATGWYLVDDASGPVGVLLPQALRDDLGTLSYVAVLPARRGAGLGTRLHALGLRLLASRGLLLYVGSTDVRNAPMLRVFARNGCPVTETETHYAAPRGG